MIYLLKMVICHSYVNVYQGVIVILYNSIMVIHQSLKGSAVSGTPSHPSQDADMDEHQLSGEVKIHKDHNGESGGD